MRGARPGALRLAAALLAAVLGGACGGAAEAERHHVAIRSMRFEPSTLVAAPGDTVVWMNHDIFPHSVRFRELPDSSGSIEPGASWTFVVPSGGAGEYHCTYHPMMTGSIDGPKS